MNNSLLNFSKKFHKTLLISILITCFSISNFDDLGVPAQFFFPGSDKIIHFIMYFTLSLVFTLEYYYYAINSNKRKLIFINLLPLLLSISFEFIQEFFTTSRNGSFYDEIFNIVGILTAIPTFYTIKNWRFVKTIIIFPFKAA